MSGDTPVTTPATVALLAGEPPFAAVRPATVLEFHDGAGLGVLEVAGVGPVSFHCTAIADGTRTIAVGADVVCRLVAAHHGRVEAAGIVSVASGGPDGIG